MNGLSSVAVLRRIVLVFVLLLALVWGQDRGRKTPPLVWGEDQGIEKEKRKKSPSDFHSAVRELRKRQVERNMAKSQKAKGSTAPAPVPPDMEDDADEEEGTIRLITTL